MDKIMISQPMNGLTEEQIVETRNRFLQFAEKENLQSVNENNKKVQDIILELKFSVQPVSDSDVPDQLIALYDFMYSQILQANAEKDVEKIATVQKMLEELLETWTSL